MQFEKFCLSGKLYAGTKRSDPVRKQSGRFSFPPDANAGVRSVGAYHGKMQQN